MAAFAALGFRTESIAVAWPDRHRSQLGPVTETGAGVSDLDAPTELSTNAHLAHYLAVWLRAAPGHRGEPRRSGWKTRHRLPTREWNRPYGNPRRAVFLAIAEPGASRLAFLRSP